MITPSSIQYISQILSEPQNLSEADVESIVALTETYPYFVPARYMEAANRHKEKPFTPPMMTMMQLYMGNWLLFSQFLQAALNGQEVPAEAPTAKTKKEQKKAQPAEKVVVAETEVPVPEQVAADSPWEQEEEQEETATTAKAWEQEETEADGDETLILPIYTEDYFMHQGVQVSNNIPVSDKEPQFSREEDKSLMVMMSFSEWLNYFKSNKEDAQEEQQEQKALKSMWQKEKLAAAMEEENEEIPEKVFEMAVNSIAKEDDLVSESLAEIHIKQGKYDKAIDMYRKLSLRNPQKSAYFARKIEAIQKEK